MSKKLIDLTGKRFGKLVVIRREGSVMRNSMQPTWFSQCDCGNTTITLGASLRNGTTQSCGCLRVELNGQRTHGLTGTPEYESWRAMRERCNNPNNNRYHRYAKRGIKVCKRWDSFENFLVDMGPRPLGMSLDRENNDRGYSPANCRWAPPSMQTRNTSRSRKLRWRGVTKNLCDWAKDIGITPAALGKRLKKVPLDKALTMKKYEKQQ